jgi:hypothetical protein
MNRNCQEEQVLAEKLTHKGVLVPTVRGYKTV